MTPSLPIGVGLTLLAGLMSGNCMLPLKFSRAWRWENNWLVFSVASLILIPDVLALTLVRNLVETYFNLSALQIAVPLLFGAGWGVAQVLFGLSVKRLGLGQAYAIIVGLGAVLGTLVPLFVQHHNQIGDTTLLEILSGVIAMITGIVLSAWGGKIKERSEASSQSTIANGYGAAVLLAILCGVMAPMLNYSFAFGQDIALMAVRHGNSPLHAAYAVWPIALAGGFLPNIAFSLYLLTKNRNWQVFRVTTADAVWPIVMAVLWMGAFALYGMSAIYLGRFGTSIGWGLFQIFMIMTATLSGVLTGEWKCASHTARLMLGGGLACLISATALLALGNH